MAKGGIVGPDIEFEEISTHPSEIDEPNMIYLTISFGSTALLEGLGRGIPCMIVRDFPVEDYTGIDSTSVPIGDAQDNNCSNQAMPRSLRVKCPYKARAYLVRARNKIPLNVAY